jgi:hypothetical protein
MGSKSLLPFVALGALVAGIPASAADVSAKPAAKWVVPRTPEGVPDLTGVYSNASTVPLERPKNLGAKEFYTPEEIEAQQARAAAQAAANAGQPVNGGIEAHYDLSQFGLDRGHTKVAKSMRTSVITGPEGRIPALIPEAQQRAAARAAVNRGHTFDSYENRGLSERCLAWGSEGPPILPQGYNSDLQIFQGKDYVAINVEMIHQVRIIPTDGSPHPPANITQWFGDSRGHWEGDTLVVDTTNFSEKGHFRESTPNLHVVERFTRTGPDEVLYQFKVEDPHTWATSWSGEYPMLKAGDRIFEYACHEGNLGLPNILSGARAEEARQAKAPADKGK